MVTFNPTKPFKHRDSINKLTGQICFESYDRTITLRENKKNIGTKTGQELQAPRMSVETLEQIFILWLESMSQIPLQTKKSGEPAFLFQATRLYIPTWQYKLLKQFNLAKSLEPFFYLFFFLLSFSDSQEKTRQNLLLGSSSPRYCFINSRTWVLLRSYSLASVRSNFRRSS